MDKYQILNQQMPPNKWLVRTTFFVLFLVICVFIYWLINPSATTSSIVIGHSVNRTARLHDEGHTNILFIKVPGEPSLIRVNLPNSVAPKINLDIMLSKIEKPSRKRAKYRFIKYIESH